MIKKVGIDNASAITKMKTPFTNSLPLSHKLPITDVGVEGCGDA